MMKCKEVRLYHNVYLVGLKKTAKALKGFELETSAILCHFVCFPFPFLPVSPPFVPHPPFVFLFRIVIIIIIIITSTNNVSSLSRWPHGLRRGSTAARLLGLRVRIPPGAWMSVCCECCVLSGRGFCVGLVTRPEES